MALPSNYDMLIFDMEDALIDQSISLGTAISRGVDTYLTSLIGVRPEGGPVYTIDDVKGFAEANDFDSDVDVMHALLANAIQYLSGEIDEDEFGGYDGRDLLDRVRESGRVVDSLGDLADRKNMVEFGKVLRSKGGGKRGFPRLKFPYRWMVLSEGHIMMDNLVKRVLAEVYLGEELFTKEYGRARQFVNGDGAIRLESSWLDPDDLLQMRKRCPFAVLTSRTQAEAQFVLHNIGIGGMVDSIVSQDAMGMGMADQEEVTWIRNLGVGGASSADYTTRITEAIERVRAMEGIEQLVRIGYVGNSARDGRTFQMLKERYRMTVIGVAFGLDKKILVTQKEKGADFVIGEPAQLLRVLSERPRMRSSDNNMY
jgi:phosphoglycolate phosphatase-like HAD superfamily hydrolase